MNTAISRRILFTTLVILLAFIFVMAGGCQQEKAPAPPAPSGLALSSTLVPNTELDVYVYIKQENPTIVPETAFGTPSEVAVTSLALWGISSEDALTFGGGLTFVSPEDAANIYRQIPSQEAFWASLSGATIYFVQGSGAAADTLKSAISRNDFKYYDDDKALLEASLFPNGNKTRLAAMAIVRPDKEIVELIARNGAAEAKGFIEALMTAANLEVITSGLYAPRQIDITKIVKEGNISNLLTTEVGILASVKSGLPGIVVSTIADRALASAGYAKTTLGDLTVYKGSLDTGHGKNLPIIFRVEGNRIFTAISGEEPYAEVLITSLNLPQ